MDGEYQEQIPLNETFRSFNSEKIDSIRGEAQLRSALSVCYFVETVNTTQFKTENISHRLKDQLKCRLLRLEKTSKISKLETIK
jgi:hypothetical protein